MAGRKLTPAAIQKAKGVYRADRYKHDTTKQPLKWVYNTLPTPPDNMPQAAKDLWVKQLGYAMELHGYISFIDLELLEQYCITSAYLKLCRVEIEALQDPFHDDHKNLWVQYHKLAKEFQQLSGRFVFEPSSRGGIKLTQKGQQEAEPEFLL